MLSLLMNQFGLLMNQFEKQQVAMILNRVWNLPPCNISHMMTVWP